MFHRKSSKPEVQTAEQRPPCDGRVSQQSSERKRPSTAVSVLSTKADNNDYDNTDDGEDSDYDNDDITESDLR